MSPTDALSLRGSSESGSLPVDGPGVSAITDQTKRCPGCAMVKPRSEFHRCLSERSGLQTRCKECVRKDRRAYRLANLDVVRATDREEARQRRRQNPEQYLAANEAWKARNREKHLAHVAVCNALRAGRLVRPEGCEECGRAGRIEGHHDDYEKRLDVRWLCPACHRATHPDKAREAA